MAPSLYSSSSSKYISNEANLNHLEARIFVIFHVVGGVGNLAMLLTALLSKRVVRHPTWLSFCVTWIIWAISYTLLLYTGYQFSEEPPPYPLCVTQASLIYAAPVLGASSSLALVMQVWLSLRRILTDQQGSFAESLFLQVFLLTMPYILWLGDVLGVLVVGLSNPQHVMRTGSSVYCFISTGVPGHISAGLVAAIMCVALVFEIMVGVWLYRYWNTYKSSKLRSMNQISLSMVTRTGLFVVLNIIAVSQIAVFFFKQFVIANIWISLAPLTAVLVFGTQKDILRVWTFRKSPEL